jgi:hypothetical protein
MALKATQPAAVTRFSLEDVFSGGDAAKLEWVSGWRKLPHVPREVAKLFEYPQRFAEEVFARVERSLRSRVDGDTGTAKPNGRLFVAGPADDAHAAGQPESIPDLAVRFVLSSDRQLVTANRAIACDEAQLVHSRIEGEFLVSYRTPGGWSAISKDILTAVLGTGRDAKIDGLPSDAAQVAKLMGPELVVLAPALAYRAALTPEGSGT